MNTQRYEEDLAYIHHVGFSDLARGATPWVIETLRKAGIQNGTIVELGCGSGLLLAALTEAGYHAIGVDASAPILEIAWSVAPAATLIHASLYEMEMPRCSAVVAVGEGLNYVADFDAPPPTADLFARIASALDPNGLLIFDVMVRVRDTTGHVGLRRRLGLPGRGPAGPGSLTAAPRDHNVPARRRRLSARRGGAQGPPLLAK